METYVDAGALAPKSTLEEWQRPSDMSGLAQMRQGMRGGGPPWQDDMRSVADSNTIRETLPPVDVRWGKGSTVLCTELQLTARKAHNNKREEWRRARAEYGMHRGSAVLARRLRPRGQRKHHLSAQRDDRCGRVENFEVTWTRSKHLMMQKSRPNTVYINVARH